MLHRRDFLNTTLAAAAVGQLPVCILHVRPSPAAEAVFLGQPLDFWVNQFSQGGDVDYWPYHALIAFGATALPKIIGATSRSRQYMAHDHCEVIREITRRDPVAVDYLLELAKTSFTLADFALREATHRDDVADFYLSVASGKGTPGQRAEALMALSSRFAAEWDPLHNWPGMTAAVTSLAEEYAATAAGSLRIDEAWLVCRAFRLIPHVPCSTAEKLRLCDLLLQLPAADSERHAPDPRGIAIEQLGTIGTPAISRLLALAIHGTPNERDTAAYSLAGIGEPALSEVLRLATSPEDAEREAAYRVLAAVEKPTDAVLGCCRRELDDPLPTVQITAALCLVRYGQWTPRALEVLRWALEQSEDDYRLQAIRGLADLRQPLPELDERLPRLLDDANPHVCDAAARRVLRARLGDRPEIFAVLVRAWRDEFGVTSVGRYYMLDALADCNGEKALAVALDTLADEDVTVQKHAIGLLSQLGPKAKAAIPALRRLWELDVRAHHSDILWAISPIGADHSVLPLVEAGLAATGDQMLFNAAARVASELGEKHGAVLVPKLVAALGGADVCVQQSAAEALGHCRSRWVGDVVSMLASAQVAMRIAAIKALGYYAPAPVLRTVLDGLGGALNDPDSAVQLAALAATERLGRRAQSLEEAVRMRLGSRWASVRYQAAETLRALNELPRA